MGRPQVGKRTCPDCGRGCRGVWHPLSGLGSGASAKTASQSREGDWHTGWITLDGARGFGECTPAPTARQRRETLGSEKARRRWKLKTHVQDADLRGADLRGADLRDADFKTRTSRRKNQPGLRAKDQAEGPDERPDESRPKKEGETRQKTSSLDNPFGNPKPIR